MRMFKSKKNMNVMDYNKTIKEFIDQFFNNPIKNIEKDKLPMVQFIVHNKDFSTIDGYEALCLDYDSDKIETKFSDVKVELMKLKCEFYMYTTSSNLTLDTETNIRNGERFRVIIPLKNIMSEKLRIEIREQLIKKFKNVDPASFNSNQRFYIPACNDENFRIFEHSGKRISIGEILGFRNDSALRSSLKLKSFYSKLAEHGTVKKIIFTDNKKSAKDHESVKYFLNTTLMKGGNAPLYAAIVTCRAFDDEKTLIDVVSKALTEKWTKSEIEQKIKCAERFIKTNHNKKRY